MKNNKIIFLALALSVITSIQCSFVSDAELHAQREERQENIVQGQAVRSNRRLEQELRDAIERAYPYTNTIDRLLEQKDKFNINGKDRHGQTALHIAAAFNHYDIMQLLLQNGADPNITDNDGETAIDTLKDPKTFKLLKQLGMLSKEKEAKLAKNLESEIEEESLRNESKDQLAEKLQQTENERAEVTDAIRILSGPYRNNANVLSQLGELKDYTVEQLEQIKAKLIRKKRFIEGLLGQE